jgi:yecA family protein
MTENEEHTDAYQELQHKLTTANASANAAEVHGVICGVISSNQELPIYWFEELFDQAEEGDLLVADCRSEVEELFTNTIRQIEDAGLGMQLLLPDDENSLATRAQAVSQWCQGFLYGIGLSGDAFEQQLSDEAKEALEDIASFTRMDVGGIEESEQEEGALVEITEFIWVASMLIRETLLTNPVEHNQESTNEYH